MNIVQNGNVFAFYESSAYRCSSAVITANNWYHLALVRSGSTVYLYTNGTRSANSYTYSTAVSESRTNNFIGYQSGFGNFQGYINAVRATRNYCRYSGDPITVPTVPFEYGTRNYYLLDNPFDTMVFTYTNYTPNENFDIIVEDDFIVSLDFYNETTNGITITGKVLGGTYNPYPVPVRRRVNLYTKDRQLINYMWSNEITGEYAFYNLIDDEYIVEAIDHTGVYDVVSHCRSKHTSLMTGRLDLVFSDHSSLGIFPINEGTGRIHGRITDANNLPLMRSVILTDERVWNSIVGLTETDEDGYYSFDDLDTDAEEAYTLIMVEDRNDEHFNDIIRARITPCYQPNS